MRLVKPAAISFSCIVSDNGHHRHLLGLVTGTERHLDAHVVALAPLARVNRDPLVAQPDRLRLLAVLPNHSVQEQE